jgi:hypothetical protein
LEPPVAEHRGLRLRRRRAVETRELLCGVLDDPRVIDRTGGRDHHVRPA